MTAARFGSARSLATLASVKNLPADERVNLEGLAIPYFAVHLIAIVGPFLVGIRWEWVLLCVALYYLRMFGITAGNHRYFAHRSYRTGRVQQFLLALLGTLSVQKGVLWWAGVHRHHHQYSDQPQDAHSPKRGFLWSHQNWFLCKKFHATDFKAMKDFAKYPELRFLNRFHLPLIVAFAVGIWLIGGYGALVWGFFVSTALLWHGTFLVNSGAHIWGKQRFETGDTSRNSWWIALLTMGEGWHNNHHHHQPSVRQGFYWWEIDVTYYILSALERVGLVWDLRLPPERVLAEGRALDAGRKRRRRRSPQPALSSNKG